MATKSKFNYWKWGVITAVCIAIFWGGCSYGVHSVMKQAKNDTVIVHDTTTIEGEAALPTLIAENNPPKKKLKLWNGIKPVLIQPGTNPFDTTSTGIDTAGIVTDWYTQRIYTQRYNVGRTELTITDTVQTNEIIGRGITAISTDSVITKTVTFYPPKRPILYLTGSVMANPTLKHTPMIGAGIGIALKLPNDKIFGLELKYATQVGQIIEARIMLPIRK